MIISHTGVNEKSKVVDAGTGSGVLASFLGRISKNVVSYERNKDFYNVSKKNIEFLESKVKLKNKDIYEGISERNLDLITLDLLEPWRVMEHAFQSLKSGGFLVCYVTNVNQLMNLVKSLRGFYVDKISENIEREWEADGLKVRPKNKGIMHTGFLVFLRRI
jgi:tRNA (adenine57-N1/adenine58-N1)-methyltransferase catalytic subunit